jgi:hypothetical protein
MKNLKRTLSLVLAVALCFSLLTMGASATTYEDESTVTYKEAVQWLSTLGIMNGELNSDGTYSLRPTDPITRAEFTKLVCTLMNGGTTPSLGTVTETSFTDTKGHWAASYIETLVSLGYISGYGDGTFGPDDTITGQQAAKILLAVLQYNVTYEKLTGANWAGKADALAGTSGLYKTLKSFSSTNLLKREEAAQMIYNALDAKIIEYVDGGDAGVTSKKTNQTLQEYYFSDVISVEGVVVANSYGSILEDGSATDDTTYIISSKKLEGEDENSNIESIEDVELSDCVSFDNIETTADMLGESVRFAYSENTVSGSTKKELLKDISVTEYNVSYTTTASGKIKEATIGMKLDCEAQDTGVSSDTGLDTWKGPLVDYDTKVYSNYKYVKNRTATKTTNGTTTEGYYYNDAYDYLRVDTTSNYDYFNAGNGWTTQFIDYNGDGDCDFVKAYMPTPYKATYVNSAGQVTLKKLTDGTSAGTYDKADIFNKDDGETASISEDDIILATIDEENSRVYVTPLTAFTGTVTSVSSSSIGANLSYTVYVDGTAYKIHDTTPNLDGSVKAVEHQLTAANDTSNNWKGTTLDPESTTISGGDVSEDTGATFYKDANGVLAYIDTDDVEAASNVKFGLVSYAGEYDIGEDGQYIKIIAEDGTESVKTVTSLYVWTTLPTTTDKAGSGTFEDVEDDTYSDDGLGNYMLPAVEETATLADSYVIAYTVKTDGSLKVYKMLTEAVEDTTDLFVDNDVAKIRNGSGSDDNYVNDDGDDYLLTSLTVFVEAEDNLAYTGYESAPNPVFTDATVLYILTTSDVNYAKNKLSGGSSTGSKTNVNFMFYYGADSSTTDDIYFYIPNVKSYTSSYASDGTTKLRTYRGIVDGVVNSALVINVTDIDIYNRYTNAHTSSATSIASKTLYSVESYDSDGKTIKEANVVATLAASGATSTMDGGYNIEDLEKTFIQTGGETYILNDSTVYINVTASTGFEIVSYDYLNEGYNAWVTYDEDTYEALQVYVTKIETTTDA